MALYPSLEDMKMDQMEKAQLSFHSQMIQSSHPPYQHNPSAPLYPSVKSTAPPPYTPSTLPYPVTPNVDGELYPSLSDYMGLELSPAIIAANMPEYIQPTSQVNGTQVINYTANSRASDNLIAPLTGQTLGLQKAQITHGIREVTLCKDASGKVGLKVSPVDNGIFVCLVCKGSPAALCRIRFGDQILQINGINVASYSMNQVHDMFRKSGVNGIKVILRDRPFERTVTLHKDSLGHIGFQFKNGEIIRLVKDSSAARNGLLTNHQLLEVDGQNVIGLKDKEIASIIEKSPNAVTVTVIPTMIYSHIVKKMNVNLIKSSMDHSVPDI